MNVNNKTWSFQDRHPRQVVPVRLIRRTNCPEYQPSARALGHQTYLRFLPVQAL